MQSVPELVLMWQKEKSKHVDATHFTLITRSFGFYECVVTSVPQVPLGWWAELQLPSSLDK